jgi:hypothetical protein
MSAATLSAISSTSGIQTSPVSWPAIASGAVVTAAFTLILITLGAGLGLSSMPLWRNAGAAAILWLIFNEIVSSAMGGYLAGRLRTKWASIHNDEVYFRDTAHGLLVWAVAVVITVAFIAAAATSLISQTAGNSGQYFTDMLFRTDAAGPKAPDAEALRIITYSLGQGDISAADKSYLQEMVMGQTGLAPADAQKRVSAVLTEAKMDLDHSRKDFAHFLLWMFIALLCGAFSASLAATIGGRQRDGV